MKDLYIFDIDGTCSLCDHRRHLVDGSQKKNWDAFYDACYYDDPNYPVITVLNLLSERADIKFFSGRRESCRADTVRWFYDYAKMDDIDLTLRPDNDYTKDSILKESWYLALSDDDKARLIGTFDDRQQVVDMWRSYGITCFQVAPGDF